MRRVGMLVVVVGLVGCDAGFELDVPPGVPSTTAGDLIAGVPSDAAGQIVRLTRLVVLAHDGYDETNTGAVGTVYAGDSGNEPGHALQMFAPQVRIRVGDLLAPGDVVDVVGEFVRFPGPPPCNPPASTMSCFDGGRTIPQITFGGAVERIGYWEAPRPIELTPAEYMADPARYQGALVTFRDLTVMTPYALVFSRSGRPRIDPAVTNEGVRLGADLHRIPGVTNGTRLRRLTGIASYFYDDFVLPRGAADVEVDPGSPVAEDGAAACGDGVDNDSDGVADCADTGCCTEARCSALIVSEVLPDPSGADAGGEWIELYNPADYPVAAGCMSLGRGTTRWEALVPIGGPIPAHGCFVVGAGPAIIDVMATFSPELADGGTPGVGVGLFDGPVGSIGTESVPVDGVIYGDDNLSLLAMPGGPPPTAHVGTPPEGSSLERTGLGRDAWRINATPMPGDCALAP